MSTCNSNTTGTAVNNETYAAIDDAIFYCDISPATRDAEHRRPSLSSPSSGYATMMRRLPATPPAAGQSNDPTDRRKPSSDRRNQSKTPAKGVTIDRNDKRNAPPGSNDALETLKSSSLPNLYNDAVARSVRASVKPDVPSDIVTGLHAAYGNVIAVTGSTCYVTPDEIDSTYLDVNELSKRGEDRQIRKSYLGQLNDPYLTPNPV